MIKKNMILTVIFVISLIILIVLSSVTYKTVKGYSNAEKCLDSILEFTENNKETIFSIDKITYFSSCDANIETNSNSSFTISDLFQYTDIAIFINPSSEDASDLSAKNTLKTVVLSNIEFSLEPTIGTPKLYYKNVNDFATSKFVKENLIENAITFATTSEDTLDFSNPILYNNCANPITLCYVNSGIEDTFTLNNEISNIAHNGSLLKSCGITLNSIACKISFIMTITNNLNEVYTSQVSLDIPLSTDLYTIYDGSLTFKDSVDYKFIRVK